MSSYCNQCCKFVSKHEAKNNKCSCGNNLKYIGTCGECIEFLEFYDGIGTCPNKDKVKTFDKGCHEFK